MHYGCPGLELSPQYKGIEALTMLDLRTSIQTVKVRQLTRARRGSTKIGIAEHEVVIYNLAMHLID